MDLKSRARIAKNLNKLVEFGRQCHENQATGQVDLFASEAKGALPPLELEDAEPWTIMDALEGERVSIGFYVSAHPLDGFFEQMDLALWYNELKRQNDIKYGSHLLNRHRLEREERAKRHVRKLR